MDSPARALCRAARETGLVVDWRDAPGLGVLLAAGPDAASFLQSQLTCDVSALAPGRGVRGARLDRKGTLIAAFSLHRLPERGQPFPAYLLVLPALEVDGLREDLLRHLVTEDVALEDATGDFAGRVIQGPGALAVLDAVWGEPDGEDWSERPPESAAAPAAAPDRLVLLHSFTGDPGALLLAPAEAEAPFVDIDRAAADRGLAALDAGADARAAWSWLRLETGWPRAGVDYRPGARVLPQLGIESRVVSATKGCYLGQEIVARLRAYGSVPQMLRALVFDADDRIAPEALPEPGRALHDADGTRIGTWGTGGWSATRGATAALAFLDRDHRTPGTRLAVALPGGTAAAEVAALPLYAAETDRARAAHLHGRAVRAFGRGDDAEAASLFEAALRLDPARPDTLEALGGVLGRAGRYAEAIDVFKRLEDAAPEEPMVHTNLSLFYMKLGDTAEAERQKGLATLKRFGAGAPDPETERTRRREEATRKRAMFEEVLALDPDDPLALAGLGNAHMELEDFAAAERCYRRARAAQSDNSPLYVNHGKALEKLGRTDDAVAAYREGLKVASRRGDLMPLRELEHRLFMLGET